MAHKQAAAKTSTINRATPSSSSGLERYCRGLDGWPRSWMGWEKDLPPGQTLVICFRPFLEYLASSELSAKTIQKHVDNLWLLGGENHPRSPPNPFLEKRAGRAPSLRFDRRRWTAAVSLRLRGAAAIFRIHLPQVPPLPQGTDSLKLAVTHRFPGRSKIIAN